MRIKTEGRPARFNLAARSSSGPRDVADFESNAQASLFRSHTPTTLLIPLGCSLKPSFV